MGRDNRQEAFSALLKQAEVQGYVTFDNIMDCADAHSLPLQDFDWLSSAITTHGIIVYDEAPAGRKLSNDEDEEYSDFAQGDYETVYNRIIELDDALEPFVSAVRDIVPPQWREFTQLKYQASEGNQHARERMIEMHLRIALKIALSRAETYDMDIQDAVGEACIGLVMAVDKYDPDTNGPFGSYASMWILQNITRRQPTLRPLMYYPVHKKEIYFSAYPILKQENLLGATESQDVKEARTLLSEKLEYTNEQTDDVLAATIPFESFEEMYEMYFANIQCLQKHDFETRDNYESDLQDELLYDANIEDKVMRDALKEQVAEVLGTLKERERNVIERRYGLTDGREKTLEEVGAAFDVTRERIRQIEAKALRKLRNSVQSKKLIDFISDIEEKWTVRK